MPSAPAWSTLSMGPTVNDLNARKAVQLVRLAVANGLVGRGNEDQLNLVGDGLRAQVAQGAAEVGEVAGGDGDDAEDGLSGFGLVHAWALRCE